MLVKFAGCMGRRSRLPSLDIARFDLEELSGRPDVPLTVKEAVLDSSGGDVSVLETMEFPPFVRLCGEADAAFESA